MMQSWLAPRLQPSTRSWQIPADYRTLLTRKSPTEEDLHPLEVMFGEVLVSKAGEEGGTIFTKTLAAVGGLIGVYFAAQSSRESRWFSRLLTSFHRDRKARGAKFEVVLVSLDQQEINFRELYHGCPGLAVMFADHERRWRLASDLRISSLPTLIFMDVRSLRFITWDGVDLVKASVHQIDMEDRENREHEEVIDLGVFYEAWDDRESKDQLKYGRLSSPRDGSGDKVSEDFKTLSSQPDRLYSPSHGQVRDHRLRLASLPMFRPLHAASHTKIKAHKKNNILRSPSAVESFKTLQNQLSYPSLLKPVARLPEGIDLEKSQKLKETKYSAFSPVKSNTWKKANDPNQKQNLTSLEQTIQKQMFNLHANTHGDKTRPSQDKKPKTETRTSPKRILETSPDQNLESGLSSASIEVSRVFARRPVAVISLSRRDAKVKGKGHALQRSRSFCQTFPACARSSSAATSLCR